MDNRTHSYRTGWRDFDPAVGQYVESDPIGLAGGNYSTYAYADGNPVNEVDPLGLDGLAGLSGGVTVGEAEAEAAQAAGRMATATNGVVGAGGTAAVANTAAEYGSGVYYNFYTGEGGGYTSGSGGNGAGCPSSDQGGLGGMLGGYIGVIMGPVENVGGPFVNRNLGIPGLPISVTEYLNSSGEVVGGAIGYGAGTGYTQTQTVTTLYPW